jgi:nucleobase:cation symporter-1, NCS1 family
MGRETQSWNERASLILEHPVALGIESHSIDFIPEHERHGRVRDQGLFWFVSNFQFFAIAIGFVGPSLGLSLGYTALAGTIGILIGTAFQAFHASQGPEMGLPQMIQSRAQFGYRGVIVPLLAALISVIGYNVVATVLVANGMYALWGLPRGATAATASMVACALAILGYDWLHRAFNLLFWIGLPLFAVLTLYVVTRHGSGIPTAIGGFSWAAFGTQLATAASFNIGSAPYVSDYSRYLPRVTSRRLIILNVFLGSALSAIWLIALGAWLATRLGADDGLLALQLAGNQVHFGFGAVLAMTSIATLVASVGMNAYSGMLTLLTAMDSLRPIRPTRSLRITVLLALTLLWSTSTVWLTGNSIAYVNALLVLMLYCLMPWTAVNLVDYFWLRRGSYSVLDVFRRDGIYGQWGKRGLTAYAIGFAVSVPFFVIPEVYTGVFASRLGGVDIGWLVGGCAAAIAYLIASARFSAADEAAANESSARALGQ